MNPHILLILIASVVVVNSQTPAERRRPLDTLCVRATGEGRTLGRILNPNVVSIELPPIRKKRGKTVFKGLSGFG